MNDRQLLVGAEARVPVHQRADHLVEVRLPLILHRVVDRPEQLVELRDLIEIGPGLGQRIVAALSELPVDDGNGAPLAHGLADARKSTNGTGYRRPVGHTRGGAARLLVDRLRHDLRRRQVDDPDDLRSDVVPVRQRRREA